MNTVLADDAYVERLKRHYAMYKAAIEQDAIGQTRVNRLGRPTGKRVEKRAKRPKPTKIKKSRRQKKK